MAKRHLTMALPQRFDWTSSAPLLAPADRPADLCFSVKDPSIVRFDDRWHVFATIRSRVRTHQIEYVSFTDWEKANSAPRHVLRLTEGYFCAPQVFYFRPHRLWYLIYQVSEPARRPSLQPAFSTTKTLADPHSWTAPTLLFAENPKNVAQWIDFWVLGDEAHAHLFFTSLDGRMWRAQTPLADFPRGWDAPRIVLTDDLFEASHTYRLKGGGYLTLVEAQAKGRRYYKAYVADRLDGEWRLHANPFAAPANVHFSGARWADSFSHGELLRAGHDERLEVDPGNLRFLYQGALDSEMAGRPYGEIPWRLGLLTPTKGT